jgi:hypothetical protein
MFTKESVPGIQVAITVVSVLKVQKDKVLERNYQHELHIVLTSRKIWTCWIM